MNVANNHDMDYGAEAQRETMSARFAPRTSTTTGLPGQISVVDAGGDQGRVHRRAPYPWAQSLLDIAGDRDARPGRARARRTS